MEDIDTYEREVGGLVKFLKANKQYHGIIITWDTERQIVEDGITIEVIPVWKWLVDCQKLEKKQTTNKMISVCGLNCEKCDAFIATKNNDQALREKTAKLWSELNKTSILPEHINCEGCRMDGAKTVFCNDLCEIRKCAVSKNYETCGDCPGMEHCQKVGAIHANNKEAKKNLIKTRL